MKNTEKAYESKGAVVSIEAHSRISVKIKDTFYTFEFVEKREFPKVIDGLDLEKERELLWDNVHLQVDKQVKEVVDYETQQAAKRR